MNVKAARNLMLAVTVIVVVVFLALSADTLKQVSARTPEVTPQVVAGKLVWQDNDCIGCHTILGNGSYYAPDLTKVYSQRGETWLKGFLADPGKVTPEMGRVRLQEREVNDLVAFLKWTDGVDTNGWPPPPLKSGNSAAGGPGGNTAAGESVFATNCSGCHAVNGKGGQSGPDLSKVGARLSAEQLRQKITNPQAQSGSLMPPMKLGEAELAALTAYLAGLK